MAAMLSFQEEFQRENQQLRTRRGPRARSVLRKKGSIRPAAGRIPFATEGTLKVLNGEVPDRVITVRVEILEICVKVCPLASLR